MNNDYNDNGDNNNNNPSIVHNLINIVIEH